MGIKLFFLFAGLSGFISVAMGAFGAHGLRGKVAENLFHAFETGVAYQISHTLALFGVCILMQMWGMKLSLQLAAYAFMLGIILFSGSLYGLALTGMKWLGPVTPIGGLAFLAGWALLTWAAWEHAR
jgi:uncharacterized membrane protein YgdD (TMEM256/DUF423 family)